MGKGKIIGVLNQKGGVGKSTIVTHLGMCLYHNYNYDKSSSFVGIYDSDNPQYSIFNIREEEKRILETLSNEGNNYYNNRITNIYKDDFKPITILKGDIIEVTQSIDTLRDHFDYSIIDVVGTVNTEGYDAEFINLFDYIIIPMSGEFEVIRSSLSFVANIIAPLAAKSNLKYGILFNNVTLNDAGNYNNLKKDLINKGYNVLDAVINDRKKYVKLYLQEGSTALLSTFFPSFDTPISKLAEEITTILKSNPSLKLNQK